MDQLVFFTNPQSRGRVVRWMLEEIGQPYRTELLEYETTMKAQAYRAINPMGKVPAIRYDRSDRDCRNLRLPGRCVSRSAVGAARQQSTARTILPLAVLRRGTIGSRVVQSGDGFHRSP